MKSQTYSTKQIADENKNNDEFTYYKFMVQIS